LNCRTADAADGVEGPFDASYRYSAVAALQYEDEAKAATNFAKHGITFRFGFKTPPLRLSQALGKRLSAAFCACFRP
jgi:hypothetical protein